MEKGFAAESKMWLEALSAAQLGSEIESRTAQGLRVTLAQKGVIRSSFVVPSNLSDKDGNWHTGAIAALVDGYGTATIVSSGVIAKASVNFDISYLSLVKIQEEVEIEGKVLKNKGNLCTVVVEVRRKETGELVVFSKQWMIFMDPKESRLSKLVEAQEKGLKGLGKL